MRYRTILAVLALALIAGRAFSAGESPDFDGSSKSAPQAAFSFVKGMKKALGLPTVSKPQLGAGNVDIEVEQESSGPFARWRVRNGRALVFIEKMPAGPTSCRVSGPEINLEVGTRPGPFPNFYMRGQWPEVITADAMLTNVIFRIIQNNCL